MKKEYRILGLIEEKYTWFSNYFLTICNDFFNRSLSTFSKAPSALPIISVWSHNVIIHFLYVCPVKQNNLALCQDSLFKLYTQYKPRSEKSVLTVRGKRDNEECLPTCATILFLVTFINKNAVSMSPVFINVYCQALVRCLFFIFA